MGSGHDCITRGREMPFGSQKVLCPPCRDPEASLDLACSPQRGEEGLGPVMKWSGLICVISFTHSSIHYGAFTHHMLSELLLIPQDPTLLLACPSPSPSLPVPVTPSSHNPTSMLARGRLHQRALSPSAPAGRALCSLVHGTEGS